MHFSQGIRWTLVGAFVLLLLGVLGGCGGGSSSDDNQSHTFTLEGRQGYNFATRSIVATDAENCDLGVVVGWYNYVDYAELYAEDIHESKDAINPKDYTAADVDAWSGHIDAPATNYHYMIQGTDGKYYLLTLVSFANQGSSPSYWKLTFNWEEVTVAESD